MAKNYVVLFHDGKTDLASDVVYIVVQQTYFGSDWGAPMVFFLKVNPPVDYNDISVIARLSDVQSIREQY